MRAEAPHPRSMIAVDTNILVYSHREDSPFHPKAKKRLTELAESGAPWAIPWPCVYEFLAIITHPKIYRPPTPLKEALQQVEYWLECPTLLLLSELSKDFFQPLKTLLLKAHLHGPQVHDARIAHLCLEHGVDILWSADRDFSRFPSLRVQNPLL